MNNFYKYATVLVLAGVIFIIVLHWNNNRMNNSRIEEEDSLVEIEIVDYKKAYSLRELGLDSNIEAEEGRVFFFFILKLKNITENVLTYNSYAAPYNNNGIRELNVIDSRELKIEYEPNMMDDLYHVYSNESLTFKENEEIFIYSIYEFNDDLEENGLRFIIPGLAFKSEKSIGNIKIPNYGVVFYD